jgi:hypothetical protein
MRDKESRFVASTNGTRRRPWSLSLRVGLRDLFDDVPAQCRTATSGSGISRKSSTRGCAQASDDQRQPNPKSLIRVPTDTAPQTRQETR